MSTITKERAQEIFLGNGPEPTASEERELARIALASLEAEPVITVGDDGGDALAYRRLIQTFAPGTKLYTAPPAPVSVPDEREAFNIWNNDTDCPLAGRDAKTSAGLAWCRRSAMLQGAENAESPTTMKTAPALDSSPKIAESNSGNSPVIPDGWVMVPAEPTAEMLQSGISAHYERSQIQIHDRPAPGPMECAYMAMILAAQQEEAKVSSPVITDGLNIRAVAALRETVRNQWLKSDNLADKIYWKSMLDIANEIISSMLPPAPQPEVK